MVTFLDSSCAMCSTVSSKSLSTWNETKRKPLLKTRASIALDAEKALLMQRRREPSRAADESISMKMEMAFATPNSYHFNKAVSVQFNGERSICVLPKRRVIEE